MLPDTVYATPGSWNIPSRVILNACALYGVTTLLFSSIIPKVFVPVRLPLFDKAPSKAGVNLIFFALTSEVLEVSTDIDPEPFSQLVDFVDTRY